MAQHVLLKNDTADNIEESNDLLEQGELFIELDTGRIKYGDGETPYNSLQYRIQGTIRTGIGPPSPDVGFVDDVYVDIVNAKIYGPKGLTVWPPGVLIKGAKGDDGDPGADGEDGAPGASVTGPPGPGLVLQGVWSAGTTYAVNDCVSYGGKSYACRVINIAIIPSSDATKWQLVSDTGSTGSPGAAGDWSTPQPTRTKTSSYTLLAADAGYCIYYNSTSAGSFTVPTGLGFSGGVRIDFVTINTGQLTIVQGSGTLVTSRIGYKSAGQGAMATLLAAPTADAYVLGGDLIA